MRKMAILLPWFEHQIVLAGRGSLLECEMAWGKKDTCQAIRLQAFSHLNLKWANHRVLKPKSNVRSVPTERAIWEGFWPCSTRAKVPKGPGEKCPEAATCEIDLGVLWPAQETALAGSRPMGGQKTRIIAGSWGKIEKNPNRTRKFCPEKVHPRRREPFCFEKVAPVWQPGPRVFLKIHPQGFHPEDSTSCWENWNIRKNRDGDRNRGGKRWKSRDPKSVTPKSEGLKWGNLENI